MTKVKKSAGRQAITRKMQRYPILKAGALLFLICFFVVVLFFNDPLPGVRKAALRQRKVMTEQGKRDFRNPKDDKASPASSSNSIEEDGEGETETEPSGESSSSSNGSRIFTFELASLKDGKKGKVVIKTNPEWAPIGVERFHELMDKHFYDQAKFFRVVDDFIVQFGIPALPLPPNKKPSRIPDDPVKTTNARGTVTYAMAGKGSRTSQLFINTRKGGNAFLDKQNFSPFAEVIR